VYCGGHPTAGIDPQAVNPKLKISEWFAPHFRIKKPFHNVESQSKNASTSTIKFPLKLSSNFREGRCRKY